MNTKSRTFSLPLSYDLVEATMECPVCGFEGRTAEHLDMQVRFRETPTGIALQVGMEIEVDTEFASYVELSKPAVLRAVRLLEVWRCSSCETDPLWAEVQLQEGSIAAVRNADLLDGYDLDRVHYLSDEAWDLVPSAEAEVVAKGEQGPLFRRHLVSWYRKIREVNS